MRLRYLMLGIATVGLVRWLSDRIGRVERRVRHEALEEPDIVRGYLRVSDLPHFRLMEQVIAARAVDRSLEKRALDVGCGPGHLAIALAKRAPKMAVIGLDLSESMIEQASGNAVKAGVADRVAFIKGAADRIPYPDGSFDLVVSTLSLHHWSDPVAVFDEIGRVLRPDGRLLVADLRRDVGLLPWLLLQFATRCVVPAPLRRIGEPMASREAAYTPREVVEIVSRSSLQNWQVTAGPMWVAVERA